MGHERVQVVARLATLVANDAAALRVDLEARRATNQAGVT